MIDVCPDLQRVRGFYRTNRPGCWPLAGLAVLGLAGPLLARGTDPCVVPDNGGGTVNLPPAGCEYLSPKEFHMIVDGLPKGTTIVVGGIHRDFICGGAGIPGQCGTPGGVLGGEVEQFQSTIQFDLNGTGELEGFHRIIDIPAMCEVHTGPRNPGDPVQSFDNLMMAMQGQIIGDPDFDLLRITAGNGFGLPSPGHTTLTQVGGGNWAVDSFFDVFYRIDFVGAPGGPLGGMSGSTNGMVQVVAGAGSGGSDCGPDPAGAGCLPVPCAVDGQSCAPICANFNPFTGQSLVTACECRFPDGCQLHGLPGGGGAAGSGSPPCVVPDNGGGTVTLPPAGCAYLSPDEVHMIVDGLPAGTQINLDPIHRDFICQVGGVLGCPPPGQCEQNGGNLGGQVDCFQSQLLFQATGTGMLNGYNRTIGIPIMCQVHTGPRTPGNPVQSFDTDMFFANGQIIGDPDFDLLRVTGGTGFGMPSPGHTTLTLLPGGNWAVDSFFDVFYRIDFVGAPGGPLGGMSGSTTATIRMATGGFPHCDGACPPNTVCEEFQTVNADGSIDICCDCVPVGEAGACCYNDSGDGLPTSCAVVSPQECLALGGTYEGAGTVCLGVGACCFGFTGGSCVEVDEICCDNILGSFLGVGTTCLGDLNGDGIDDACLPPPPDCEPDPSGTTCAPSSCPSPGHQCVPVCVGFDPTTGLVQVIQCECRGPQECQVGIPGPAVDCGNLASGGGPQPCVQPDAGGTVILPPPNCAYVSPDDAHRIIDGLPPGTEIIIGPEHQKFMLQNHGPGGTLGGEFEQFGSFLFFDMCGTGALSGFQRNVGIPIQCETHIGPRTPGMPVQSFDTDMFMAQGQIIGDPDFDLLRVTGGTNFGLRSPGHTTLTQLPGGNWAVDSFFDITYRIDFVGAPGGPLQGMSGSTTATIRMATGGAPRCVGSCPLPGMVCLQTTTVTPGGSLEICCDCVFEQELGACCLDLNGDGVAESCQITIEDVCASQGGTFLGAGTTCLGDLNGDGYDDTCVPPLECGPTPAGNGCLNALCDNPAAQECVPVCGHVDPFTGLATVLECSCRNVGECHLVFPSGPPTDCPQATASQGPNGCVVPDAGGTVMLPPPGCSYLSPDDVHRIIAGLPGGTTIELGAEHAKFALQNQGPGGSLGGRFEQFSSFLFFDLCGTGALEGYQRFIGIPIQCETHTAPRVPGMPIQDFDTLMFMAQGQILGDPDFDLLRVTAGNGFGLPSPGHTTLIQLPGGQWAVDSFFDITYRIDFVGAPGGPLGGMSGSTTATIRMATGGFPHCEGNCPPGQECVTQRTVAADGTVTLCCECVTPCLGDTNGDGVVNVADLTNVILRWNTNGQGGGIDADVNNDGIVNVADLTAVILNWGPCP